MINKYLKTVVVDSLTFIYARQQNKAQTPKATNGTPRLSVRASIEGADRASAKAYIVRHAIYKSEFEAEMMKIRMQAFKKPGKPRRVSGTSFSFTGNLCVYNRDDERRGRSPSVYCQTQQ